MLDIAARRVAEIVTDAREYRQAHPGCAEHHDHGGVAALLERSARALPPSQVIAVEDQDRPVRDARRPQPGHQVGDLIVGGEPLEELPQRGTREASSWTVTGAAGTACPGLSPDSSREPRTQVRGRDCPPGPGKPGKPGKPSSTGPGRDRATRGDVLIDAHLTLQLARDILVIAMLLRDRDVGLPITLSLAERT